MSIRFAAAHRAENLVARRLRARTGLRAANDNASGIAGDRLLRASLQHFARHGLCAAERARAQAEAAFFAGDREEYQWWLAICRVLDRRMAEAFAARSGAAQHG